MAVGADVSRLRERKGKVMNVEKRSGISRRQLLARSAGIGAVLAMPGLIGRAHAASGTVTFYTTMPNQYADPITERFNATLGAERGITLESIYVSNVQQFQKVQAENATGRVQHDLTMLADASMFLDLKAGNMLLDYVSPEIENYPAEYRDVDGIWCNARTLLSIYNYNPTRVPDGAGRYKSWADFPGSEFEGRFGINDVLGGGVAVNNYIATREHPDLGLAWWQEIARLRPQIQTSHGILTQMVVSGETPVGMNLDYNAWEATREKSSPLVPVYPEDVVTVSITPLGIARNAPNPEAAKVVYDWFLSQVGQEVLRDINGIYSPRADVAPLAGQPRFEDLATYVPDLDHVQAVRDEYREEFRNLFDL